MLFFFDLEPRSSIDFIDYVTLTTILGKLGGLYSIVGLIAAIALSWLSKKEFLEDIAEEIKNNLNENVDKNDVHENLQDRVSFAGIYNLYDEIEKLKTENKSLRH